MKVIRLAYEDYELCRQAANLHISSIHLGLLPLLGDRFMSKMYLGIAVAPQSGVWAIVDDDKLVGFIAGCASVQKTYSWILANYGIKLAMAAGLNLFRLTVLQKLSSVLNYPFRQRKALWKTPTPEAELLAIAISKNENGKGYGRQLVNVFEDALRQWGVQKYRVLTNITETASNGFYLATGFAPVDTIRHHALTLQVYEKVIT
jgi:GNAT superfamily N-acetyltransferase